MSTTQIPTPARPGTARAVRLGADVVGALLCALGAVIVLADLSSPVRPPVVLVGAVIGTGWGLVGWIRLPEEIAYVAAVTVAVGAAVAILVSVVMVETAWWHPLGMVATLLVVGAALNALRALTRTLRRAGR